MWTAVRVAALAVIAAVVGACAAAQGMRAGGAAEKERERVREVRSFDSDWRFFLGDPAGAEAPAFDDAAWEKVDVPHDWSISGAIDRTNRSGSAQAFLPMGVGWYRKSFEAPAGATGKHVFIEFDGVVMDSTVWINGQKLGERPNGYSSFRYDLTEKLRAGNNVLAVRVDNSVQPSSRWYAGSGITRHVRLIETNAVHIGQWATYITTPRVTADEASVHVETAVVNESSAGRNVGLQIEIMGPDGRSVKRAWAPPGAKGIEAGQTETFAADLAVEMPQLWGPESPALYTAIVRVIAGKEEDDEVTAFGIRTTEFKSETGFWLNGKNVKLQGVCLHLDGGGVGGAVPMGVWERRLDALRSLGVNAVRTSHNPPDPAFMDLLDRKGFLVMHEIFDCWTARKNPGDYARFYNDWWERDLSDAVRRDRNHPSIVIYSAGNEIHDGVPDQLRIFPQLRDVYHRLDPSRPVTLAMLQADRPTGGFSNGLAPLQDVVGANYRPAQSVAYARQRGAKVIETETNYNANELQVFRDSPELSAEFLWTGVDYLGEGMGGIAQGFGLIDRTGEIRARGYEHQAWWTDKPMVKIARVIGPIRTNNRDIGGGRLCDWTPENQAAHTENVEVYSNCEEVELFLNGRSLGALKKPADVTRKWQVGFEPGVLRAVARNKGEVVANDELRTAGPAAKLMVAADQKTLPTAWDDVAFVRVNVTDAAGVTNPLRRDQVTFSVSGPGLIMAVDNADLDSVERFRGNQRKAYMGTCIAVIKATGAGTVTVRATAVGLEEATTTIEGKAQ